MSARVVSRIAVAILMLLAGAPPLAARHKKNSITTIRWDEGKPGCTYAHGDDGKDRYAIWTEDLGVTLAVDSQELLFSSKRVSHVFGVLLTVKFRGDGSLDFQPGNLSLEFVDHHRLTHTALDPEEFSTRLQSQADDLSDETEREIRKHPEKKEDAEKALQAYLKDTSEMQDFLGNRSLQPARLDAVNSEINGWVFFWTRSKWIGSWKNHESFVLRVPIAGRVLEYPFTLPPKDLTLRRRD